MKTILMPTDFSNNSLLACDFAIKKLGETDTNYVINYVYNIPMGGTSGLFYLMEELQKQGKADLKEFKIKLENEYKANNLQVETHLIQGNFSDETTRLAEQINASCIVVGTKGSTGLKEVLVGSNTLQLIKTTKHPLYIIPENYKEIKLTKVIIAYDGDEMDPKTAAEANYFAKKHKLPIELLHIRLKDESPLQNWEEVKAHFKGIEVDVHEVWGENIEDGLKKGTENAEGILVMTYRKKSFWERFFNISDTRNAVMQARLPMLIVPE